MSASRLAHRNKLGASFCTTFFAGALLAALTYSTSLHAQELNILAGPLISRGETSYSWQGSYREGLGRYAAWSFSWINEGHIPDHHRDGQTVQLWARLPLWRDRFELSAGGGPYRYFDTTAAGAGGTYSNTHGWGAVWSARAAYYFDRRWIAQMQFNHVQAFGGPDTTALLFGVGYQLDASGEPGPRQTPTSRTSRVTDNELTILLGKSILNSYDSQTSFAQSIEYRRGITRYIDGTVSYIHEASNTQTRRDGVALQLWATRGFFNDRFTLAVGAGPYIAISQNDTLPGNRTGDGRVSGLVSMSASYRLGKYWLTRLTWNRVVTRYDRDADVIEAGIGVRF